MIRNFLGLAQRCLIEVESSSRFVYLSVCLSVCLTWASLLFRLHYHTAPTVVLVKTANIPLFSECMQVPVRPEFEELAEG